MLMNRLFSITQSQTVFVKSVSCFQKLSWRDYENKRKTVYGTCHKLFSYVITNSVTTHKCL